MVVKSKSTQVEAVEESLAKLTVFADVAIPNRKTAVMLESYKFLQKHGILAKVLSNAKDKSEMLHAINPKLKRIWNKNVKQGL